MRALEQHRDNSSKHHVCGVCPFDGKDRDDLHEHYQHTIHRIVCKGCNGGAGFAWDPLLVSRPCEEDNVCDTCYKHFEAPNSLKQVSWVSKSSLNAVLTKSQVHLDKSVKCYACTRMFKTYPAMILHPEALTCDSQTDDIDLNFSAARCYQWKAFVDAEHCVELLNREDPQDLRAKYDDSFYPFRCPTCKKAYSKLSGLFQHAYSDACSQEVHGGKLGKLTKWLKKRHKARR